MQSDELKAPILSAIRNVVSGKPRPAWIRDFQAQAVAELERSSFPTTRAEDWKYTNVEAFAAADFLRCSQPVDGFDVSSVLNRSVVNLAAPRLVFLDGSLIEKRLPPAVVGGSARIESLEALVNANDALIQRELGQAAVHDRNFFTALNSVFCRDGAVVDIPSRTCFDQPIYIVHMSSDVGSVRCPRVLIRAGTGSAAKVVEIFVGIGESPSWTNAVAEIICADLKRCIGAQ